MFPNKDLDARALMFTYKRMSLMFIVQFVECVFFLLARIPIDYLLPDQYLCRGGVEDGDRSSTEARLRKGENGSSFPWPRHYCFPNIPRRSFSLSRFGFDQSVSFRTSKAPHSLCSMRIFCSIQTRQTETDTETARQSVDALIIRMRFVQTRTVLNHRSSKKLEDRSSKKLEESSLEGEFSKSPY